MKILTSTRLLVCVALVFVLGAPIAGSSLGADADCSSLDLHQFCVIALTNGDLQDVVFSPDGSKLAYVGHRVRATILNVPDGTLFKSGTSTREFGNALDFSSDGKVLATGGQSGISLWNIVTDQRTFIGTGDAVSAVSFSPDGARIAAGLENGMVLLADVQAGEIVASAVDNRSRFGSAIVGIDYAPNGTRIASNSIGGAKLWSATDLTLVHTLVPDLLHPLGDIAFSPNGRFLAHGDKVPSVPLWRVGSSNVSLVRRFPTLANGDLGASSVSFSPNGQRIAVGAFDYEEGKPAVRLWDVDTGEQELELFGVGRATHHVAYAGTGAYVAAASNSLADGTLNHLLMWRVR